MDLVTLPMNSLLIVAAHGTLQIGLPVTAGLGAVALIGYLFGNRTRTKAFQEIDQQRQQELDRAARIAWQLEVIASGIRQELVSHHAQLNQFKGQLRQAQEAGHDDAWERLCNEAEAMLGPTMQLANQLSSAYDQIRQQSDALETFTQGRTDPLTGVGNGRALEQRLRILLNGTQKNHQTFSAALVSLDRLGKEAGGSSNTSVVSLLPKLASVIRDCMRGNDFVARYGEDEFVVVLPKTPMVGARVFANRLRVRVADELSATFCCGLTEVQQGDDPRSLLARADSALYSAKAAGQNRLFTHNGSQIREDLAPTASAHNSPAGNATLELVTS